MVAIPVETMSNGSGEWIVNRYQLQEPIGQGAMGTVYRAVDARLGGVTKAIKFLAQTLQTVEMCDRFEREARVSAQLSCDTPYIVSVTDYGVDQNNRPFYVMEYLQGTSLKGRMRPHLPLPVFLNLSQQICLGLQRAHEGIQIGSHKQRYPVIHCDLKPSNIFVIPHQMLGEAIRILDFGIASLLTNREQIQGFRGGTLPYCSPEQLDGQRLDPRSDLYSLGVLMFEMLTGRLPLYPKTRHSRTPSFQDWYQAHQVQVPRALTEAAPDRPFPQPLSDLILQCLAKNPSDRPQSATQILQVLRELGSRFGTQLPDDRAASETSAQNQSVMLPAGQQRSSSILTWQGSIGAGKIIARPLFSGQERLATLRCMLPDARIRTIQIHQQYNTVKPYFLFVAHPHPMLLWVTMVYTPKHGFVWLPYYLDMKQPQMLHLAQLVAERDIYQVLFFDFDPPHSCSHILSVFMKPEQSKDRGWWVMQSRSLPAGSPADSKKLLKEEYEKLKRRIEDQFNQ